MSSQTGSESQIIEVKIQEVFSEQSGEGSRSPSERVKFMIEKFQVGHHTQRDLVMLLGDHLYHYPEYRFQVPSTVKSSLFGTFEIRIID